MSKEHNPIQDYSWLNSLPDNANLVAKDLTKIFGYASLQSIFSAISKGVFPEPDTKLIVGYHRKKPRVFWTVKTIKNEIKRREKIKEIERLAELEGLSVLKYLQKQVKI